MADDIDQAQEMDALFREAALSKLRAAIIPEETAGDGACIDCGDEIAPARLLAVPTACRCTICQNIFNERTRWGTKAA